MPPLCTRSEPPLLSLLVQRAARGREQANTSSLCSGARPAAPAGKREPTDPGKGSRRSDTHCFRESLPASTLPTGIVNCGCCGEACGAQLPRPGPAHTKRQPLQNALRASVQSRDSWALGAILTIQPELLHRPGQRPHPKSPTPRQGQLGPKGGSGPCLPAAGFFQENQPVSAQL